jgi:hypothetical protein
MRQDLLNPVRRLLVAETPRRTVLVALVAETLRHGVAETLRMKIEGPCHRLLLAS